MHEAHGRALQEGVANLDCLAMMAPAVKERYDFVEHIRRYDDGRKCCGDAMPMSDRRFVVLVVIELERQ